MFVNELRIYVNYLKDEAEKQVEAITENQVRYLKTFQANLLSGIGYYMDMLPFNKYETVSCIDEIRKELDEVKKTLQNFSISNVLITA
jgi:hypothetical protein